MGIGGRIRNAEYPIPNTESPIPNTQYPNYPTAEHGEEAEFGQVHALVAPEHAPICEGHAGQIATPHDALAESDEGSWEEIAHEHSGQRGQASDHK